MQRGPHTCPSTCTICLSQRVRLRSGRCCCLDGSRCLLGSVHLPALVGAAGCPALAAHRQRAAPALAGIPRTRRGRLRVASPATAADPLLCPEARLCGWVLHARAPLYTLLPGDPGAGGARGVGGGGGQGVPALLPPASAHVPPPGNLPARLVPSAHSPPRGFSALKPCSHSLPPPRPPPVAQPGIAVEPCSRPDSCAAVAAASPRLSRRRVTGQTAGGPASRDPLPQAAMRSRGGHGADEGFAAELQQLPQPPARVWTGQLATRGRRGLRDSDFPPLPLSPWQALQDVGVVSVEELHWVPGPARLPPACHWPLLVLASCCIGAAASVPLARSG